jgi:hypothetical protein
MTMTTICPPDHKHSTTQTCYTMHGCRCTLCGANRSLWTNDRARRMADGTWTRNVVDATPVLAHLDWLEQHSIRAKAAAALAGVAYETVRAIRAGRPPRPDTAERILAVRPNLHHLQPNQLVPARSFTRRFEALVALGYTNVTICAALGYTTTNFTPHKKLFVRVDTMRRMITAYERLSATPPPRTTAAERAAYAKSITRAHRNGWVPPLAWDDIDHDDAPATVTATPGTVDELAVALAVAGERVDLTPADRRAAVRILHGRRYSDPHIADTLHTTERTVLRIRDELHLPGIPLNDSVHLTAA